MPAPRKFQKPTERRRNQAAQRCGKGVVDLDSWAAPSWRNDHAYHGEEGERNDLACTRKTRQETAMCSAGSPEK